MTFDPSKKIAEHIPPTQEELLGQAVYLLTQLVDLNTPGVPGIRGAQETPELDIHRESITSRRLIPGNRRRSALMIRNTHASAILYVMDDETDPIAQGFPVRAGETFIHTARASVWLEPDTGTIDVALYEVST